MKCERIVPLNLPPFNKIDLSYPINISLLPFIQKGIFTPRKPDESWINYIQRENKAITIFTQFALGKLGSSIFQFSELPESCLRYAGSNIVEFECIGESSVTSISVSSSSTYTQCERYFRTECINDREILNLYDFCPVIKSYMRNPLTYLSHHANYEGKFTISAWVSRTGIHGRTSILEKLSPGEELFEKLIDHNLVLVTSMGDVIGDLAWSSDVGPDNANAEYWDFICPLQENGTIRPGKIYLTQVIPHGNPNGRKRKALAEVQIEYYINNLPLEVELPYAFLENCANSIRTLAYVDYNRKYDMIMSNTYHSFSESYDLLRIPIDVGFSCLGKVELDQYVLLAEGPILDLRLDTLELSARELSDFWNIYLPLLHLRNKYDHCREYMYPSLEDDIFSIYSGKLLFTIAFSATSLGERCCNGDIWFSIYRIK